jgi:ABC-2 type transport system permease protein
MLMQAVLEEKTSRIVEIIVSSVKPFQLMMGKIIGIGLVGLTQFALWILMGIILLQGTILGLDLSELVNNQDITQMTNTSTLPAHFDYDAVLEQLRSFNFGEIIGAFILYFVGGYLLYGAFFTAIGAAVDTPEDAQPFMTPMIIVIVFTMMFTLQNAESANGALTLWGSMIPFTAPFMMLARIPFGVPTLQLIASLVILYATALLAIYAAGKIYSTGILRYGSKLLLKNILKRIAKY